MSLDFVDKRVKKLIKLCFKRNHRSLFSILGRDAYSQVSVFYDILSERKSKVQTLYCSKDESEELAWKSSPTRNNESFIRCSYNNISSISHRLFHFAVFQDMTELTPDTLSAALKTVQGGGIILFLFPSMKHVEDLKTLNLNMGCKPSRFSRRLASLLCDCPGSFILDDKLSIISSGPKLPENIEDGSLTQIQQIQELQQKHESDPAVASLIGVCRTIEQAELLLKFQDVLKKQTLHSIFSVSSPVGRGKSAILGLAIALSLELKYSNIFISSSSIENVDVVFKFLLKGLDALNYKEDTDFDLIESDNLRFKNTLMGVDIFRDHPQSVRFIFPCDIGQKSDQAELIVFDEPAALPLSILKNLSGSFVVLMASSTSGPGATNPDLYNKMVTNIKPSSTHVSDSERFQTLTVKEPIFYASNDHIESWVNQVFCLEPSISTHLSCGFPIPEQCRLFCVNRDALFSGSSQAEEFLQNLSSILSSSSRTMDPNYILNLADSPDYRIYCLLPPASISQKASMSIICALLVHIENEIPDNIIHCGGNLNNPSSGCFNEWKKFVSTSTPRFIPTQGAHVLNIVTHQSYRKMGYGSQALQFLQEFYEGKLINLDETCMDESSSLGDGLNRNSSSDSSFLQKLTEVQSDSVEYILVSCNLVSDLLRFWKKVGFVPVFISDKKNSEETHTLFMVKSVENKFDVLAEKYWHSFLKHYCSQLGSDFRSFEASLALTLIHVSKFNGKQCKELGKGDIDLLIRPHQMKSLEKYCQNLQDFHSIMQFIPTLASLYFKNYLKEIELSRVQEAILLSYGLQYKTADEISKDLGLPNMQVHGLLNRTLKKITKYLTEVIEKSVAKSMETPDVIMKPIDQDLNEELEEAAQKIKQQQELDALKLRDLDISQYAIKGSEDEWQKALFSGRKTLVSIKSLKTKTVTEETNSKPQQSFKKNKQQKKRKK
ncbi:hypothetical protein JTE90_003260 [Oedothorax gibbosus]|uniref:RNA cytidine acetyltransferase n=1 Tax=Oedothorax gibbosus TaxID=931172 RepID=A0AAV6V396_9ARAC|nr:hypothetical protein JTE90_003260 [Oedothorax gibbosus]